MSPSGVFRHLRETPVLNRRLIYLCKNSRKIFVAPTGRQLQEDLAPTLLPSHLPLIPNRNWVATRRNSDYIRGLITVSKGWIKSSCTNILKTKVSHKYLINIQRNTESRDIKDIELAVWPICFNFGAKSNLRASL